MNPTPLNSLSLFTRNPLTANFATKQRERESLTSSATPPPPPTPVPACALRESGAVGGSRGKRAHHRHWQVQVTLLPGQDLRAGASFQLAHFALGLACWTVASALEGA